MDSHAGDCGLAASTSVGGGCGADVDDWHGPLGIRDPIAVVAVDDLRCIDCGNKHFVRNLVAIA